MFKSFSVTKTLFVIRGLSSQKRSYHPGEMAPLRTPYDFDDEGNATSTSTTEPSSSGFRSSITSRYTTEDATSTMGDDTSVPGRCKIEWSHFRISSADSKVRTTLYNIINSTTGK